MQINNSTGEKIPQQHVTSDDVEATNTKPFTNTHKTKNKINISR